MRLMAKTLECTCPTGEWNVNFELGPRACDQRDADRQLKAILLRYRYDIDGSKCLQENA